MFVGDSFAAAFAQANPDVFDEVHDIGSRPVDISARLAACDLVVSVMDSDLVMRAVAAGRPVAMVDSLFSFWRHDRSLDEIAGLCASAPLSDYAGLTAHFGKLSPHEQILAAHVLADQSILQNFPGVPERVQKMVALCGTAFHLTGSIVDSEGLHDAAPAADGEQHDLVINLGGFKNFFLDFEENNDYLELIDVWVRDLLTDWHQLDNVLVCGGAFRGPRQKSITVNGRTAEFTCLSQRPFLREVAAATQYMMTPGLTALHEAMALGRLPMALPEQHYGHVVNMRMLKNTTFARVGATLAVPGVDYPLVEDDFEGTRCIVAQARRLLDDNRGLERFRSMMGDSVQSFFDLTEADRAHGLVELRRTLDGPPVTTVLRNMSESLSGVTCA
ncbi:hypothetical protein [Streptomyces sp. KL2]|uniref:hypothetical protein n=1 Tax=Streptomyces sp. KL2 TaxID=3050126 RepID=UPI00397BE417